MYIMQAYTVNYFKRLAHDSIQKYHQLSLEDFNLPFGGKLNPENRGVKWSLAIPWDELASGYYKSMSSTQGVLVRTPSILLEQ